MNKTIIRKGSRVIWNAYGMQLKAKVLNRNNAYCTIKTEPFLLPNENVYLQNGQVVGGVKITKLVKI